MHGRDPRLISESRCQCYPPKGGNKHARLVSVLILYSGTGLGFSCSFMNINRKQCKTIVDQLLSCVLWSTWLDSLDVFVLFHPDFLAHQITSILTFVRTIPTRSLGQSNNLPNEFEEEIGVPRTVLFSTLKHLYLEWKGNVKRRFSSRVFSQCVRFFEEADWNNVTSDCIFYTWALSFR